MSLLFNRVGGCCCPPPSRTQWPLLRFLPGLIIAALLLGLGIFFLINYLSFLPIVIIAIVLLFLLGLIIFL